MKRKQFVRKLLKEGCILLRHGARHDIYQNPATGKKQPVPLQGLIFMFAGYILIIQAIFKVAFFYAFWVP